MFPAAVLFARNCLPNTYPITLPHPTPPQLFLLWPVSLAILLILVLLGMFKDIIRTCLNIYSTGLGKHRCVLLFQSFLSGTLNGLKHRNSLRATHFSHCSSVQNLMLLQGLNSWVYFRSTILYQKVQIHKYEYKYTMQS